MNFSLEIGPHTDLETLPPVNDVYITLLPGGDYKETAKKAGDLVKKSFNPVPHFPARSINNETELKDYVSICKERNLKSVINHLKESGLKIISCTEKSDVEIYSVDFSSPVCIILGSEKDGISNNLLEISDVKAKIPMKGKIDSLNVSSSSSVILYELIRQRD